MKNITIPTTVAESTFENISNSKKGHKATLKALKSDLFKRYSIYERNTQKLEDIAPSDKFNGIGKKALLHCYEVGTKPLEALKVAIFNTLGDIGKSYCPYCLISEPRTMDHYLPKELFPEFSVLPINLIPCCFDCNNTRGKKWLTGSIRNTINAYFDAIENKRFLYASFDVKDEIPQVIFSLKNEEGIPSYIFEIIKNHFDTFKLQARYRNQINSIVSEIYSRFSQPKHKLLLDKEKQELLLEEVKSNQANNGKNYWKAVVIEALASSEFLIKI